MGSGEMSWPLEVRLRDKGRLLTVAFDDGHEVALTTEYLRVMSPSAEVRGHSPDERKTVSGKAGVAIRELVPVGNYALRPVFDDGHETGIFTWKYLRELADTHAEKWAAYLGELEAKGLSRER